MSRENRAKQFMPFAALKGLEEALEKKEKIVVPKAELCDDYKEQLDFRRYCNRRLLFRRQLRPYHRHFIENQIRRTLDPGSPHENLFG